MLHIWAQGNESKGVQRLSQLRLLARLSAVKRGGYRQELGVTIQQRLLMTCHKYIPLQLCKQILGMYYKSKEQLICIYKKFSQNLAARNLPGLFSKKQDEN